MLYLRSPNTDTDNAISARCRYGMNLYFLPGVVSLERAAWPLPAMLGPWGALSGTAGPSPGWHLQRLHQGGWTRGPRHRVGGVVGTCCSWLGMWCPQCHHLLSSLCERAFNWTSILSTNNKPGSARCCRFALAAG